MGVIYQLTFFLALGLLAIVVTVFVFAISLLGRAIEVAAKEQEKTTKDQKDAIEIEIAEILKQISSLQKKKSIGKELQELEKSLKKLRKQDEKFARKLGRIVKAPELLTVKGGVVPPASYLLGALILSGGAWYLANIQLPLTIPAWIIPTVIWLVAFAGIGYSIFRIYQSLKVIESVAITSEEAALKRTVEAFKMAEKELEEERRPEVTLRILSVSFPLTLQPDSEKELTLEMRLQRGDYLENMEVFLIVPPDFSFPSVKSFRKLPSDHLYPRFPYISHKFERIVPGMIYTWTYKIKSPTIPGKYPLIHSIVGQGMKAKELKKEIIVK